MFNKRDKVKELAVYFAKTPNVSCLISNNKKYEPVGVSVVKTYKYQVGSIEILYNKWFVEAFESAKQMNLPGCEHHDKLVKGSGVCVSSPEFGYLVFYGKDAQDIINACESGCTAKLYGIETNKQK